jgi:hypothetical protein
MGAFKGSWLSRMQRRGSAARSAPWPIDLTGWKPLSRRSAPALGSPPVTIAAPDLAPAPVPQLAQIPDPAALILANVEPLDDAGAVALQLAALTQLVGDLRERVEALERPWAHRRQRRS